MALGHREHVEAVGIIRNLLFALGPHDQLDEYATLCAQAGAMWLEENHPTTDVYMGALEDA